MLSKNIIFDLDGTLWNTISPAVTGWNLALSDFGIPEYGISEAQMIGLVGQSREAIFNKLFPQLNSLEKTELGRLCDIYQNKFIAERGGFIYPKVIETIKLLHAKSYHLFIVSNCQLGYIEMFLKQTNLQDYFTDFESWEKTKLKKSENIRLVMSRNEISDAWYIGDTMGDYEAAKEANVDFVFASYGFGTIDIENLKLVSTFEKIPEYLNA